MCLLQYSCTNKHSLMIIPHTLKPKLAALAPCAFILIWASGYIVAKFVVPYAPPLTFLSLRFVGCLIVMAILAAWAGKALPRGVALWHTALVGILMQVGYLVGCWMSIAQGMPAGVAALVVNLQPVLTAALGFWLGERVTGRQWTGLALGFVGVVLVLSTKLTLASQGLGTVGWLGIVLIVGALWSMTVGTLYQKRFCPGIDPRASQVVQFAASLLVTAPLAWMTETQPVIWGAPLIAALLFSVLVLSAMGISLFLWMIAHGQATRVTGYMYWVPPVSSIMAWALFGERITGWALLGFVAVGFGVYWAVSVPKSTDA